jgi:hypothetical protein
MFILIKHLQFSHFWNKKVTNSPISLPEPLESFFFLISLTEIPVGFNDVEGWLLNNNQNSKSDISLTL